MATYYVSDKPGMGKMDGTEANPFTSLQAAADKVEKGDTVLVKGGIYTDPNEYNNVLTIRTSGIEDTKDATGDIIKGHITFKAFDPDNKPVIKVSNFAGISVLGSYIDIEGFNIQGNRDEITDNKMGMSGVEYAKYLQKQLNPYPDPKNPFAPNIGNPLTSGFGIIIGSAYENTTTNNVTVKNSTIQNCTAGGIAGERADNVTIEENIVSGNSFYSPYATSGISFYQSGNDVSNNGTITIKKNTVYDNKNLVEFFKENKITDGNGIIIDDNAKTQPQKDKNENLLPTTPYGGNTLIQDNYVYSNGGSGISAFNSSNVEISGNNRLNNNYLSRAEIDPKGLGGLGGQISVTVKEKPLVNGNSDPTQVKAENINIFNNNITYSPNTPSLNIGNGGNASKHVFAKFSLNGSSGADNITLNSLQSGQKFRLTTASGGAGNDVLTGSGSTLENKLFGEDGNDILNGANGVNINKLSGGNGSDVLYAGESVANYNSFEGGAGNDTIHCDFAKKVSDVIYYKQGDDTDTVYNYSLNNGAPKDQLRFSGISNINVKTSGNSTQFYDAATNGLLVTTANTTGFMSADVGQNLFGSNFTFVS